MQEAIELEPDTDHRRATVAEIMDRFNNAFVSHDAAGFAGLIADDCVMEAIEVGAETATIRWRFRYGSGSRDYVRGVNLMRVRDGKIVEALGYGKTPAGDGSPLGDVVTS